MARIILLWQTERDLRATEIQMLQAKFGPELQFIEKRPRNLEEHQKLCELLRPSYVLAPRRPVIGSSAHLPFTPNGETLVRVPHGRFVYECVNANFTHSLVPIGHHAAPLRHVA